jgi:hypothetical protein
MQDGAFSRPVILFSPQPDGSLKHVELANVQDAFRALNRGLEGYCLQTPEWHLAFHTITRAILETTPERVAAAQEAMELLAGLTRGAAVNARAGRASAAEMGRRTAH